MNVFHLDYEVYYNLHGHGHLVVEISYATMLSCHVCGFFALVIPIWLILMLIFNGYILCRDLKFFFALYSFFHFNIKYRLDGMQSTL